MNEALAFLMSEANMPFAVALVLMLLIGVVEAIGLGGSAIDFDHDLDATWLGWLGFGRVPLLVILVSFLALFAMAGLVLQQVVASILGAPLSGMIATLPAALVALPLTGISSRALARILPHDETTAVPLDALIGQVGTVTIGAARQGSPARARVEDHHGQPHYVMVEPDNDGEIFAEGATVILVRQQADLFRCIAYDNPYLPRLDP